MQGYRDLYLALGNVPRVEQRVPGQVRRVIDLTDSLATAPLASQRD